MAKKLKDYYDIDYALSLSEKIKSVHPTFDTERFTALLAPSLSSLAFNDRQVLIAESLKEVLALSYPRAIAVFMQILGPELPGSLGMFTQGWWLWPIGKYVELFGAEYFAESSAFSKELTKRFTAEFCMRPLIAAHPKEAMQLLLSWSTDENKRVRRLSSECLRIRLPWAKKMYTALCYFESYVQLLSNLKDDQDKTIQKSVANNLNDLYKEDEEKFNYILSLWTKETPSKECAWIIQHASRSLRKKSDA